MTKYSQRDPKWANTKIGSKGTIKDFGCLITSLGMLLDIPPDVVNARLKAVGGYANGNLVIWTKIPLAFPQCQFSPNHGRFYVYNNTDVRNNLPCLVEVDAKKIGGTKHWVLFIGNQRMYDPWDGKEKSTSTYDPLLGYAIVRKR